MKMILGLALIALGLFLGIYVGVYLMLIGGIIQIVEGIKATPIVSWDIAIGVIRFMFAGAVGWIAGFLPAAFGIGLLKS